MLGLACVDLAYRRAGYFTSRTGGTRTWDIPTGGTPGKSRERRTVSLYRERGSWKESPLTGGKWGFRVVTVSPGLSGRAGKTFLLLSSEGMWAGEARPFPAGLALMSTSARERPLLASRLNLNEVSSTQFCTCLGLTRSGWLPGRFPARLPGWPQ